jgi:hypothetical protein
MGSLPLNLSYGSNSLITGKITGNFRELASVSSCFVADDAKSPKDFKSLREIPCSFRIREFSLPEQGIIRRNRGSPSRLSKMVVSVVPTIFMLDK